VTVSPAGIGNPFTRVCLVVVIIPDTSILGTAYRYKLVCPVSGLFGSNSAVLHTIIVVIALLPALTYIGVLVESIIVFEIAIYYP
jgi:hypothetical protein